MPYKHRRPHLHSRRQTLHLEMSHQPVDLWFPPVEDPIVIDDFSSAASLALMLTDAPVEHEAVVLMDEYRQVTAILFDPPPGVGVFPGLLDGPGFEVGFCYTMTVVLIDEIDDGAPSDVDRHGYDNLRKLHALQGLHLLDVILTNGDRIRSLSIGCDPDSAWFEDFVPPPAELDKWLAEELGA